LTNESVRGGIVQAEARRQERKQQLLQIALELFATVGYEKTKVSDIVAKGNVSQGTFYWYFKSKEAIALEMLEIGRAQLLDAIKLGYRTKKVDLQDSVASTTQMFERIFHFAENNKYFMNILLKGIHSQPKIQEKVEEIKADMETAFAENIAQAKELKMISREVDPKLLAVFIMSLLEGVLARWLFQSPSSKDALQQKTLQQLIEETVHFEFFGIFGV
jgi:Transcriptional regulator